MTKKELSAQALYMRNWRAKRAKKAAAGDPEAIKSKAKESRGGSFRSAKSFILKSATRHELSELRDTIAKRVKILAEKEKKQK